MKSPWDIDHDKAFEPMYDEAVTISCIRDGHETKQAAKCFVSSAATGEPYAEDMLDTERVDLSFSFHRRDWALVQNLQRGDKITRCGLFKQPAYVVQDVKADDVMGVVVTARGA